jgi:23S rRNA pseudouridine1911/1915/1917 synthase
LKSSFMSITSFDVLFEDNHLLVVNKPPGIATQGAEPGSPSLLNLAKDYLKSKYSKPGNAYVGVVSRLDAVVSGVVVLAKTSKAAERLNEQFRQRTVKKTYWALVEAGPSEEHFVLVDWLKAAETRKGSEIARPHDTGALEASLQGRVLKRGRDLSLLEIDLLTGRKHQIRVQLASRGWPILGDKLYGSIRAFYPGIALHARSLGFAHPTTKQPLEFDAPPGVAWKRFFDQIGFT